MNSKTFFPNHPMFNHPFQALLRWLLPLRKLNLSDLELSPQRFPSLKTLSRLQRRELCELCEVLFLTSHTKESRQVALRFKEMVRALSLTPKINELPFDKSPQQMALEERNPYLPKQDA